MEGYEYGAATAVIIPMVALEMSDGLFSVHFVFVRVFVRFLRFFFAPWRREVRLVLRVWREFSSRHGGAKSGWACVFLLRAMEARSQVGFAFFFFAPWRREVRLVFALSVSRQGGAKAAWA